MKAAFRSSQRLILAEASPWFALLFSSDDGCDSGVQASRVVLRASATGTPLRWLLRMDPAGLCTTESDGDAKGVASRAGTHVLAEVAAASGASAICTRCTSGAEFALRLSGPFQAPDVQPPV